MKSVVAVLAGVFGVSAASFGASTTHTCKNGTMQRRVEVSQAAESAKGPCEVKYFKDTEEPGKEPRVLYNSATNAGFCQTKAGEFMKKLNASGWQCDDAPKAQTSAPTTPAAASSHPEPNK